MLNVTHKITGHRLIIEVDLSPRSVAAAKPSTTGKTHLLATSQGPYLLPPVGDRELSFAINVMLKP